MIVFPITDQVRWLAKNFNGDPTTIGHVQNMLIPQIDSELEGMEAANKDGALDPLIADLEGLRSDFVSRLSGVAA